MALHPLQGSFFQAGVLHVLPMPAWLLALQPKSACSGDVPSGQPCGPHPHPTPRIQATSQGHQLGNSRFACCDACRDELRAAWAIFTPLLKEIDAGRAPIFPYSYGSRGPPEADDLLARTGFVKNLEYIWRKDVGPAAAAAPAAAKEGAGGKEGLSAL